MLGQVAVQEGKVAVHHRRVIVVAEETPDTGLAVADGAEIQGPVSFAEAEIRIRAVVVAHFPCEGNHVGRIHTLVRHDAEAQFLIGFARLWELADAAGVGVGGNAIVRHAAGHPYGPFAAGALADDFHDPGLLLVADGEGFPGRAIPILPDQLVHDSDGLPGRGRTLQGQMHQREVVQVALRVHEFLPPVPGRLDDAQLLLVHLADDGVGIGRLRDVVKRMGAPAPDRDHFPGGMGAGPRIGQGRGIAESVTVVGADHASVHGSLFAHDQVGASLRRGREREQECGRQGHAE